MEGNRTSGHRSASTGSHVISLSYIVFRRLASQTHCMVMFCCPTHSLHLPRPVDINKKITFQVQSMSIGGCFVSHEIKHKYWYVLGVGRGGYAQHMLIQCAAKWQRRDRWLNAKQHSETTPFHIHLVVIFISTNSPKSGPVSWLKTNFDTFPMSTLLSWTSRSPHLQDLKTLRNHGQCPQFHHASVPTCKLYPCCCDA